MTDESMFPPIFWSQVPSDSKRANNGPESFHPHCNEQLYSSHPSIYVFIDNIIKFQSTLEKEKEKSLVSLYGQYCSEQISRPHFVKTLGFKYQARTDL
jgi:hypothetical protein